MTLTGDAAKEFMDKASERAQKLRAEKLDAAKAEAAKRGKESFDLAKLETMCDTSHEGKVPPVEERQTEHEWMYYVHFRDVMTLADYAKKIDEQNRW